MFLLLFGLLFFTSPIIAHAQIPLFYQLLQAYKPSNFSSDRVLGISITAPALPTPTPTPSPIVPANIGGEGKIYTIGILGDSMIQTLGKSLPHLKKALRQYYPNRIFNLLNFGQGSRNIEYGLSQELPLLISQKPDIVVIESFAYNNLGNSDEGINRHWLNLGAITTTINQQLPDAKIIIAATIAPNSVVFGNGIKDIHFTALGKIEKTNTIKLYLQNTTNFAVSQGFPLADAYHPSLFNNEGFKEFIDTVDNLHPSDSGKTFFSDTIADTIAKNKLIE